MLSKLNALIADAQRLSPVQEAILDNNRRMEELYESIHSYGDEKPKGEAMIVIKQEYRKLQMVDANLDKIEYAAAKRIDLDDDPNPDDIPKAIEHLKKIGEFLDALNANPDLADAVVTTVDKYAGTVMELAQRMTPGVARIVRNVIVKASDIFVVASESIKDHTDDIKGACTIVRHSAESLAKVVDPPAPTPEETDIPVDLTEEDLVY